MIVFTVSPRATAPHRRTPYTVAFIYSEINNSINLDENANPDLRARNSLR